MAEPATDSNGDAETEPALAISPEKVCYLIVKAREFDVKDAPMESDPASNPSDDMEISVLEDRPDDPVVEEIAALIRALDDDERTDLVALAWLGRGDYDVADWPAAREAAAAADNRRTASYLLGIPLVGDFLEEGLSLLGQSCEEYEIGRL
jgi:hypothetical protein